MQRKRERECTRVFFLTTVLNTGLHSFAHLGAHKVYMTGFFCITFHHLDRCHQCPPGAPDFAGARPTRDPRVFSTRHLHLRKVKSARGHPNHLSPSYTHKHKRTTAKATPFAPISLCKSLTTLHLFYQSLRVLLSPRLQRSAQSKYEKAHGRSIRRNWKASAFNREDWRPLRRCAVTRYAVIHGFHKNENVAPGLRLRSLRIER